VRLRTVLSTLLLQETSFSCQEARVLLERPCLGIDRRVANRLAGLHLPQQDVAILRLVRRLAALVRQLVEERPLAGANSPLGTKVPELSDYDPAGLSRFFCGNTASSSALVGCALEQVGRQEPSRILNFDADEAAVDVKVKIDFPINLTGVDWHSSRDTTWSDLVG
jgi:hypothetical protein